MYCSNQSSVMATLLQQKSFMKNLTNGGNNVVVVTNNDNGQNTSLQSAPIGLNNTETRMLLPHEMDASSQNLLTHSQHQSIATSSITSFSSTQMNSFNHQFISHLQSNAQLHHQPTMQQFYNPHVHVQQPFHDYNHVYRQSTTTTNHIYVNGQVGEPPQQHHQHHHQQQQEIKVEDNENSVDGGAVAAEADTVEDENILEPIENEPEIDIVINNVVCSFSVRCHLNLREIALNGFNVEFRRENGMVTMKLRQPYTTASIWSSGKITCTGATSEDQAKVAARRYSRCLQKLGFNVKFRNFRIVNVLGTCSMPWGINIIEFSKKYKDHGASYEPELHPGVTYKLKANPKATLKIFSTGSITVTAASVAFVQAAIEHIFPLVYEFRKERTHTETAELNKPAVVEDLEPDKSDVDDDEIEDNDADDDNYVNKSTKAAAATAAATQKNTKLASRQAINKRKANEVGGRAKFFAKKRQTKRPAGRANNDPREDIMNISDSEIFSDDSC